MLIDITKLCSSTDWLSANIGLKYLQVMQYIMRVDISSRLEDRSKIKKYEILSIVIKRILGVLKSKVRNQTLTDDD